MGGLSNAISTTKYTFYSFLPKYLFEQFRKYWNLYFLLIGGMQQIPDLSPTGRWNTILPLTFILTMTGIKEIYEDFHRRSADNKTNGTEVSVLSKSQAPRRTTTRKQNPSG